jgi:hypothetical protein
MTLHDHDVVDAHHHGHRHGDGSPDHQHHGASTEAPYVDDGPTSGPSEALVLDIGGDIGALILHASEACLGTEIDLAPVGMPQSHLMHTMVRRRRAVDREFIAGVYPELVAGDYVLWGTDGAPLGTVTITGGRVSEFHAGDCRTHA